MKSLKNFEVCPIIFGIAFIFCGIVLAENEEAQRRWWWNWNAFKGKRPVDPVVPVLPPTTDIRHRIPIFEVRFVPAIPVHKRKVIITRLPPRHPGIVAIPQRRPHWYDPTRNVEIIKPTLTIPPIRAQNPFIPIIGKASETGYDKYD